MLLASQLSFWLDETIQLEVASAPTFEALLDGVATQPGAVPLGYIVEWATISSLGFSPLLARLPSILAALGTAILIWKISRIIGINSYISVAIFLTFPVSFRYATEARPYMLALFFSTAATFALLRLRERPAAAWGIAYSVALVLAALTQPYGVLIAAAHVVWLFADARSSAEVRRTGIAAIGTAAAGILPWYVWQASLWRGIAHEAGFRFHFSVQEAGMLVKELSGGYVIALLLLPLCVVAFLTDRLERRYRWLLTLLMATPVVLALAIDMTMGYFVAVRQFIYILPAYALLAAAGIGGIMRRDGRAGMALASLTVGALIVADMRFVTKPREDWAQAARVALTADLGPNGCIQHVDPPRIAWLSVFEPGIERKECRTANPEREPGEILLVADPYMAAAAVEARSEQIRSAGFMETARFSAGMLQFKRFAARR